MTGSDVAAIAARRGAVTILDAVLTDGMPLSEVLTHPQGPLAPLSPPDRARAQRMATDTLRRIGPADAALRPHLRRKPEGTVLNLLRVAVVELSDRPQDAHGIVNAAVTITRGFARHASAGGFVNAVLRKLATGDDPLAGLPVQQLPDWLRAPLKAAYGAKGVAAIEVAHAAGAPLDLTAKRDAATLAAATAGRVMPTGSVRLTDPGQVTALPGYAAGDWWVQDAAAALPALALAVRPGERVLDLCAAPGGKTLQLAAMGAAVTALDQSVPRMARVGENLARCGLAADLAIADARDYAGGPFDAVLLDAPCSATGTIRRHPDLPFVRGEEEMADLVALQAALFDRAVALTRPGGRIVFSTCSLLPAEGERQVAAALARHRGLTVTPIDLPGLPEGARLGDGTLRLRPDMWAEAGGIDGFFVALFTRA